MVDSLTASQAVSMAAPQLEVDPAAKGQKAGDQALITSAALFLEMIKTSFGSVNELTDIEKEDPILDDEEEESKEREEK